MSCIKGRFPRMASCTANGRVQPELVFSFVNEVTGVTHHGSLSQSKQSNYPWASTLWVYGFPTGSIAPGSLKPVTWAWKAVFLGKITVIVMIGIVKKGWSVWEVIHHRGLTSKIILPTIIRSLLVSEILIPSCDACTAQTALYKELPLDKNSVGD